MGNATPEVRVKREIRACLNKLGAYSFMPVQTGYGQKTLDYLCCVPGLVTPAMVGQRIGFFVAVEAKRAGVYPTKFQELTTKTIVDAGGIAISPAWHQQHILDALRNKGVLA